MRSKSPVKNSRSVRRRSHLKKSRSMRSKSPNHKSPIKKYKSVRRKSPVKKYKSVRRKSPVKKSKYVRSKSPNRKLPLKKSRSVRRRSPVKKSRSVNRKIMLKGGGGGKLVDCPARCVDGFYAYSVDGHRINNGVPCPVCRDTGQIPSDVLDMWMKDESYRLYFVQTPNYEGKISIYDFKKLANDYGRDTGGGCLDYISENRANLVLSPDATEEF